VSAIKKKNILKIFKIQNKSVELSLLLSIPASFGLVIAAEEIVNALLGYGSFSEENIKMTASALKYFGYGIPAFALVKVLSNFFFARDDTKTPFYISVFIVLLNVTISLSFFKEIGFIIIPIATSISTWLGVLAYTLLLRKYSYFIIEEYILKNISKIIFSSTLMSLVLFYSLEHFKDKLDYFYTFKAVYLLLIVSFAATIYLITCYLLGVLN